MIKNPICEKRGVCIHFIEAATLLLRVAQTADKFARKSIPASKMLMFDNWITITTTRLTILAMVEKRKSLRMFP
jgi:hypothetical protein